VRNERERAGRLRSRLWIVGLLVSVPLLVLGIGVGPAAAETVVTTIHVPAQVETNPCFPADVINLSGDIQIVVSTTADGSGGYHVVDQVSSKLKGVSITTGTKYVNNANQTDEWTAQPPFPVIHTHTYDFLLISKSNVPNYVLHMAMHETIDANGVPTVVVDNFYMDCQG
jgi:hypothetical protein